MARTPQHSIPARIFLGFAVVLVSLGGVSGASLWQHQRTAQTLILLHEGYLPLSLSISEARATQGAFATMVERSLEGSETAAAEGWLEIARRVRPFALRRALDAATQAEQIVQDPRDRANLARIRTELEGVLLEYELSEDDFDVVQSTFGGRDRPSRAGALASIRGRERQAQAHLAVAWQLISERIAATSRKARDDERRAFGLLVGLGLVALAVSFAITIWSQRMLAPLTKLAERVAAVARGDLARRVEQHSDDEIGHVATEFERMVDALNARDDQLRRTERLAAVGRLAAHVTHEVRNPLNSIRLNVEMLEEDAASSGAPETQRMLASILREVDRLTDITEQYLRLVRLPEPKLEPVDLTELSRDVAHFLQQEMAQANVALEVDARDAPRVCADEGQLRQALLNLCRNAREAMPGGGRVRIEFEPSDGGTLLAVSDQGAGIAEADRNKVFDLFYTTKEHGTGLGLSLTQQIVSAHGGRIRCEASEWGGTRFAIWLPRAKDDGTPLPDAKDAT